MEVIFVNNLVATNFVFSKLIFVNNFEAKNYLCIFFEISIRWVMIVLQLFSMIILK